MIENLESVKMVNYDSMQTRDDVRMMLLSWVHDLNFVHTRSQVLERGYFEVLSRGLKEESRTAEVLRMLENEFNSIELDKGLKEA